MRQFFAFIPLLAALLASPLSNAAAEAGDPCLLLDWHDLQFMGVTQETTFDKPGWQKETTPAELPGGSLFTALCAAITKNDKGRASMTLTLTSVKGDVTEVQFAAWLKTIAAADSRENEKDVKEFKIEDAECESGRDELTIPGLLVDEKDTVIVEHFVACDKHVGLTHVSLNAQVAAGRENELPNPAQVKALLDKSVARLTETAFRTPD